MKITLVQPPLLKEGVSLLNPPTGLLALGGLLRAEDAVVEIVDLNLRGLIDPDFCDPATFYERATDLIAATGPDIVGFTSMALESHVALELARRLRATDPAVRTWFGGPHFGAIATEAMARYEWMDFVVAGEGEKPTVDLYRALRDGRTVSRIPNVAHRTGHGVQLNRQYRVNYPFADLPFPDHDLVDLAPYFELNPLRMLTLEHARGCQLRCAFCYSEAHWGHGESAHAPERVVEDLVAMEAMGAGLVFLVADNFLTNRRYAEDLCAAIAEAKLSLKLKCYATLAQLDERMVGHLESAGCVSVFVGVDAVSEKNKRDFKKSYFKDWPRLEATLKRCLDHGITPTCSFMLSADDTPEGVEETLRAALFTKQSKAFVSLNALGVYNATRLRKSQSDLQPSYDPARPVLLFDTHQLNAHNPYASRAPALFPMHNAAAFEHGGGDLHHFTYFATQLISVFAATMTRLAFDSSSIESLPLRTLISQLANDHMDDLRSENWSWSRGFAREVVDLISLMFPTSSEASEVARLEALKLGENDRAPYSTDVIVDDVHRHCLVDPGISVVLRVPPAQLGALSKTSSAQSKKQYRAHVVREHLLLKQADGDIEALLVLLNDCAPEHVPRLTSDQYLALKRQHVLRPIPSAGMTASTA